MAAVAVIAWWLLARVIPAELREQERHWRFALTAMAGDRVNAVDRWLSERKGDALVVAAEARGLLAEDAGPSREGGSAHGSDRGHIEVVMAVMETAFGYEDLWLLDRQGRILEATPGSGPPDDFLAALVERSAASRKVEIDLGLHGGVPRVGVAAPLVTGDATGSAAAGFVLLVMDPTAWLYPALRPHSLPSDTMEAVLMRRDGDTAVFLSPLRFGGEPALSTRRSLTDRDFAARHALAGERGFGEFTDYRGVPILAATRRLTQAPWGLVVKIDRHEALAEFRAWRTRVLVQALMGLAALSGVGLLLRRRQRLREALVRARSETRLALVVDQAHDAVLFVDEVGVISACNQQAEAMYRRSRGELLGAAFSELFAVEAQIDAEALHAHLGAEDGAIVETVQKRGGGATFPAEVSVRRVRLPGEHGLVAVVRDISARRTAEERIQRLHTLLRTVSDINQLMVREADGNRLLGEACSVLVKEGDLTLAWVVGPGRSPGELEIYAQAAATPAALAYAEYLRVRLDDSDQGRGLAGIAARERRSVVVQDWETDPQVAPWREAGTGAGFKAGAAAPILIGEQFYGVLAVYSVVVGAFDEESVQLLEELADNLGFALRAMADRRERAAARRALAASEARFRAVFEESGVGIAIASVEDDRFTAANPALCRMLGYSEGELLERTEADVSWPDDLSREREAAEDPEDGSPRSFVIEKRYSRRDGGMVWVRVWGSVVSDEGGNPAFWVRVVEDITGARRAEEYLRRLDTLVEHARDAILMIREDGRIIEANRAAGELYGASRDELCTMTIADLWSVDPGVSLTDKQRAAQSSDRLFEAVHRHRDGRLIPVEVSSRGVVVDGADVVLCIVRDLTERHAEEAGRRLLAAAVEQSAEAVLITDRDGVIQFVNSAFERITGYGRDEVVGRRPSILKSGRHGEAFYRKMWETILGGGIWHGHMVNRRKDGALFEEDSTIFPVHGGDGEVVNFVCTKRDVSAEVSLQEQLAHAQRMEAVGRLAGGIAHDFNNLLQGMLAVVGAVSNSPEISETTRRQLTEMDDLVRRGAGLTRQLLVFSRRDDARVEICDLNQVVRSSAGLLQRLLPDNIAVESRLEAAPATVVADRGLLEQVIMNLAVNGGDAMPEGGCLRLRTGNRLESVVLEVSDTGCGIPEALRGRIFEPFFTTKEVGRGTGLGLAVVHGIVTRSGGVIEVESGDGGGTTFRVVLPEGPSPSVPQGEEPPPLAAAARARLLLVEDEPSIRDGLAEILSLLGHDVTAVASAEEALAAEGSYDLLLTDLSLPGMSGAELAERLRAHQPALAVVMMSGYAPAGWGTNERRALLAEAVRDGGAGCRAQRRPG